MQVTKERFLMDIFYINCFSHSLYLSRARNNSCFSCFLTIVYAIYIVEIVYIWEKRQNKNAEEMRIRLKKESGAECRGDA